MATAAALLMQINPLKCKQSYPNNLWRPLRPLPAKPVKLSATFKEVRLQSFVSTVEKRHLTTADSKSKPGGHAKSLQSWQAANPNAATNKLWANALKAVRKPAAAAVLLGMLLTYKPKSALAVSVGRVHATSWSPWHSDLDSDSWKQFMPSHVASMTKIYVASRWFVLYSFVAYFVATVVLLIMCRLLQWPEPSWMKSALDGTKFLLLLPILHLSWVLAHDPSSVFKLQLQVSLSNAGRALQTDLNRIAEIADTSTYEGLNSILTETVVAFLRHPDCFISASSHVAEEYGIDGAQNYLNKLSLEERVKFYEQPKSSTSQNSANEIQDEYMEVTILVAAEGKHELPTIISGDDLKKALRKLASIDPADSVYVYGVEVLWTPKSSSSGRNTFFLPLRACLKWLK